MPVQLKQQIIETELNSLEGWDDKFTYIIEKGQSLQAFPISKKTDEYLIRECQSKLWMYGAFIDQKFTFYASSETVIVRGIVAILLDIYAESTPREILDTSISVFEKSGLNKILFSRVTGIQGIINKIEQYAKLNI